MATRFYLGSFSGDNAVSPAFDAGWERTSDALRFKLYNKRNHSISRSLSDAIANIPITTTQDILLAQYVSDIMPAQVFTGTVSLVIRVLESALTANATLALVARVVSQDGGTVRGTLFSVFGTDTEFAATAATRIVNAQAITSLTVQQGDRLVVEIGATATAPTAATTFTARHGFGTGADFALTTALTTDLNPWIEFSQDIYDNDNNNYQTVHTGDGMSTSGGIR